MINELANKVPTMVQYMPGSDSAKGWGFLCDQDGGDSNVEDCFKLHLDPEFKGYQTPDAPTLQQARRWFQDFLRGIHDHIIDTFPRWGMERVEFIFSVPTTWKNPSMVAEIERLIKNAGFGRDGPEHRAGVGLTEAEAAAVYASKQQYDKDDVILVCDAGGGTTDVNVLRLQSSRTEPTRLQQLSWVEGRPIGSTSIDMECHSLLVRRLRLIQNHLHEDVDVVADQMMQGRFERLKCSFGEHLTASMPNFPLSIPDVPAGLTVPGAKIENSAINLSRSVGGASDLQDAADFRPEMISRASSTFK